MKLFWFEVANREREKQKAVAIPVSFLFICDYLYLIFSSNIHLYVQFVLNTSDLEL